MPTGVAIRDVREQLFDAAERILLRDGPSALTSRAVTTEAGVAKGVLHRHFTDFDAFLAELVLDRIHRIQPQTAALRDAAGTGTVADNLTAALTALFSSVAVAIVPLVTFRDELRARLRAAYLPPWSSFESPGRLARAWELAAPLGALHQAISYRSLVASLQPPIDLHLARSTAWWLRQVLAGLP